MSFRVIARGLVMGLGILTATPALAPADNPIERPAVQFDGARVSAPAATPEPADPIRTPLWQDAASQAAVADTVPARLNRYQLISFPLLPVPATLSSIFNELGNYDVSVWRLGHWDPTLTGGNKYQEPPAFSSITQGHGYFFITRDSTRVAYDGVAAPADTFSLPLLQAPLGAAEWNQLGNPFNFNSAVTNWRVVKRDSLLTLGQAATRTWIDANMRVWNPNTKAYTAAGTIARGAGFFARLVDPDTARQWTRWTVQDTGGTGYWSSVRFDSKGSPHIVYYQGLAIGSLRYATRNNTGWLRTIVDNSSTTYAGVFASIELDSLGRPYVASQNWHSDGSKRPFFTRMQANGSWTIPEQIEVQGGTPSNGWGMKIKLFHGVPRVAFSDQTGGIRQVKYGEKTISGWNVEPVSQLGWCPDQVVHDLGFDISSAGVPHIAATSANAPYSLRYFTKTGGTWVSQLVDTLPSGSTGIAPSLVVDAAGVVHISYFEQATADLKYARRQGSGWVIETVDATPAAGFYSEIVILGNGQPGIAFLETASMSVPNRIRFASRSPSGSWTIETVDDVNVSSGQAYLGATLDPQGNPCVSYQGVGGGNTLRFAEKIRGSWRILIPPIAAPEPSAAEGKPEGADWAVAITARQGDRAAEPMFLGVAAEAEQAALRSSKAPAPPGGGMLSLSVPRGTEEFVRDFQSAAETVRWRFATEGGVGPGEQTLDFAGYDLPQGLRMFLSDPDGGWTREVRAGESVVLAARPRMLELVATTGSDVPAVTMPGDGLSFAYPNPFAANTGLAFTMARPGDIRVDLFDVGGRRVRTIERLGAGAGEHVLTWDGRDAGGRLVPSGIYLAAWRAGEARGARRLVKVD